MVTNLLKTVPKPTYVVFSQTNCFYAMTFTGLLYYACEQRFYCSLQRTIKFLSLYNVIYSTVPDEENSSDGMVELHRLMAISVYAAPIRNIGTKYRATIRNSWNAICTTRTNSKANLRHQQIICLFNRQIISFCLRFSISTAQHITYSSTVCLNP